LVERDPRFDLLLGEDAWTVIGEGVEIQPTTTFGGGAEITGFLIRHTVPAEPLSATPGWCVGGFSITDGRWFVTQDRPLTITPSIQCVVPGHSMHGFIRDGRWQAV